MAKATKTRRSSTARALRADTAANAEARHAPVSLPSGGSYDAQALQKGLDAAANTAADGRDAKVSSAIADASNDSGTLTNAPNALPGHRIARAEVMLGQAVERDGKMIAGETVTEFRQVYDPSSAESETETKRRVVDEENVNDLGGSEVLSLKTIEATKPAKTGSTSGAATTIPASDGQPGMSSNPDLVEASIAAGLSGAAAVDAAPGQ